MTREDLKAALRNGSNRDDLLGELHKAYQEVLQDTETASAHKNPMHAHRLKADDWEKHKAHMLDGGGVDDPTELGKAVVQALFDGDQETYWSERDHLVKSFLKRIGRISQVPGGAVFHGVGSKRPQPSVTPLLPQMVLPKE